MIPAEADYVRAVELLRAGELVAFPTETVYGLGADAANPAAVAKIFAAKGVGESAFGFERRQLLHMAREAQ